MAGIVAGSTVGSAPNATPFLDVLSAFSLAQINEVPSNVQGNILDLILTNTPDLYSDVMKLPCDFTSDHAVLYCAMSLHKHPKKCFQRIVYNFKSTDFNTVRSQLAAADLKDIVTRQFQKVKSRMH